MTFLATVATVALLIIAAALALFAVRLLRGVPANPVTPPQPSGSPTNGPDPVIAGPPQVRGDTVRDWLMHYTHGRKSWADAVTEFYRRAVADPQIAGYFTNVELPTLQRHFTAAIIIVTSRGLTAKTVVRMAEVHRAIRNDQGEAITGEVYDKVIAVLVDVLRDMGVPGEAIADLAGVVAPLRAAIVAA